MLPGLAVVSTKPRFGRFQKVEGTEQELPAELVLLAMGFTGVQRDGLVDTLGVEVGAEDRVHPTRAETDARTLDRRRVHVDRVGRHARARHLDQEIAGSEDAIEGPRAFREKRDPVWKTT